MLNYGKRFAAKRQAAMVKWTALYQFVCMVLITIITSTSHKAITTLHLLRSAHWSPAFAAEPRPERERGMWVERFETPTNTTQELPSLDRLQGDKHWGGWWEIWRSIVSPLKDATFLMIVCDEATFRADLARSIRNSSGKATLRAVLRCLVHFHNTGLLI